MWRAGRLIFPYFFVPNQKQTDRRIGGRGFASLAHPDQIRGNYGFHIRSAAAPEVIAFDPGLKLAVVRFGLHHIIVAGDDHRSNQLTRKASPIGWKRPMLESTHLQAPLSQDRMDHLAGLPDPLPMNLLADADRRDLDQFFGEAQYLRQQPPILFHCSSSRPSNRRSAARWVYSGLAA